MRTIEQTVYSFDELSERAKDKARDWWRDGGLDYEWWDSTYDDALTVGLRIDSFDLDRNRHATGEFVKDACKVASLVLANHGESCETFKTAKKFLSDFAALRLAQGDAETDSGFTYEGDDMRQDLESEFLKSLLEDYSIMLQSEVEWLLSDEQVDETILANGYEFDEEGGRV